MPHQSIIKILEAIRPNFMQNIIGTLRLKHLLNTNHDNIIEIIINFLKKGHWKLFPKSSDPIKISKTMYSKPKKIKNFLNYLYKKCKNYTPTDEQQLDENNLYLKLDPQSSSNYTEIDINHIVHTIYITLEAYLDAFSVENVTDTLENLNKQLLLQTDNNSETIPSAYGVSEHFIKKYRSIYQMLKELMTILNVMRSNGTLPEIFKVLDKIDLLRL